MEHPSALIEPETGGNAATQGDRLKRSDELLETRKYYPGDDVRRLSWKLYAHSGELFLKIGEETPPPHSRLLVLIDTGVDPLGALSPFLSTEGLADYLDSLIVSCADFCLSALDRQIEVIISFSGLAAPLSFSVGMEHEFLAACSGVTLSLQGEIPPLPNDAGLKAFLFALPRSPSLSSLASESETARYPVSFFFKESPTDTIQPGLCPRHFLERGRDEPQGERAGGNSSQRTLGRD
jgi:hypothetical protein